MRAFRERVEKSPGTPLSSGYADLEKELELTLRLLQAATKTKKEIQESRHSTGTSEIVSSPGRVNRDVEREHNVSSGSGKENDIPLSKDDAASATQAMEALHLGDAASPAVNEREETAGKDKDASPAQKIEATGGAEVESR